MPHRRTPAPPYEPTVEERRATARPTRLLPRTLSSLSTIEPGASGFDGVPGYITPSGMAQIMLHLRHACRMRGKGSLFCDIGCGEARPMLSIMEGCPRIGGVIGFDVDGITLDVAKRNLARFRALKWDDELQRYRKTKGDETPDPAPVHCLLKRDLVRLEDLACVTHAYTFCNGMPDDVLRHLFRVCASSEKLRYVVFVFKKVGGDAAYELVKQIQEEAPNSIHMFVNDKNASLLRMPGQVAHGCCIRMSHAIRLRMLDFADGVVPQPPSQTLHDCFVNM